jgi:tetratricopeptide (TPR) repeat protein
MSHAAVRKTQDLDAAGIVLLLKGDYPGALEKFDASLARDPKNARALANRCTARYKLGDDDGALADFDAAVLLKPGLKKELAGQASDARYRRALKRAAAGDRAKAAADLYAAVKLDRRNAAAYAKIGELALRDRDPGTALGYFDRALKISKDFDPALAGRAEALLALGKAPSALADADAAILLRPSEPGYFALRGRIQRALGRPGQAEKDERRASALEQRRHILLNEVP